MNSQKFFICGHCGNLAGLVLNHGVSLVCCEDKMTELEAVTSEANENNHRPDVTIDSGIICVSADNHPADGKHHVEFVYLETKNGGQRKSILHGSKPSVKFALIEDEPLAAYIYCSVHGLWRTAV